MLNQIELKLLKKGDNLNHFFVIRKSEIRLTKNNRQFISLDVGDKSLTMNANLWENFETILEGLNPAQLLK